MGLRSKYTSLRIVYVPLWHVPLRCMEGGQLLNKRMKENDLTYNLTLTLTLYVFVCVHSHAVVFTY